MAAGLGVAAVGMASTALTGVAQAATTPRAARPVVRTGKTAVTPDTNNSWQINWDYCANCAGLWYTANGTAGNCPASGSGHIDHPSDNYQVTYNFSDAPGNPPDPQPEWSWCTRCQGLFFGPNVTESVCPAGGPHNRGTRNYSLFFNSGDGQAGWWHCTNCQGVFYAGTNSTSAGVCPATHGVHDGAGSYPYDMIIYSS